MIRSPSQNATTKARSRRQRGWALPELLAVILLVVVLMLVAALSVYRGKAAADELACQDHVQAIRSALEIYWTKNGRAYPADQAEFERFLADPAYFPVEPRCPADEARSLHYLYSYDPAAGPESITITCPVPGSGHGSP